MTIDEDALMATVQQTAGFMVGANVCADIQLGDRLGLHRALHEAGDASAGEVASRAGTHERLTRGWLDGQSAAGLVVYDADGDTYSMTDEAAMVLVDETPRCSSHAGSRG